LKRALSRSPQKKSGAMSANSVLDDQRDHVKAVVANAVCFPRHGQLRLDGKFPIPQPTVMRADVAVRRQGMEPAHKDGLAGGPGPHPPKQGCPRSRFWDLGERLQRDRQHRWLRRTVNRAWSFNCETLNRPAKASEAQADHRYPKKKNFHFKKQGQLSEEPGPPRSPRRGGKRGEILPEVCVPAALYTAFRSLL
jgi:hypothetical protein